MSSLSDGTAFHSQPAARALAMTRESNATHSSSSGDDRDRVHSELQSRFGIEKFRPGQEEIILKVLAGQNVLAIYPAGYGKSLLYQLPASLLPGMTLVFSPLVALMHDQQATLSHRYGVPSVGLTHVLRESKPHDFSAALSNIRSGMCKVVFISPERLDDERVMDAIRSQPISLVVLDEAHCISLWGHDFRPHYRRILRFVAEVRPSSVLGLTATAPPPVEADILRQMAGKTEVFRVSPHVPNLRLHVFDVEGECEKLSCLARIIPRLKGSGIVYCGTHEECENVAEFLTERGIDSTFYHAGLGERRRDIEVGFLGNRWKVVAATCALGMGIDKPDLRFVIHYRLPGSPELYYQEIGRAGRDGQRAECVLLFDPKDRSLQEFFLRKSHPESDDYEAVFGVLDAKEPKSADEIASATGLSRALIEVVLDNLCDADLARRAQPGGKRATAPQFSRARGHPSHAAIEPFLTARRNRIKALDAMMDYGETTSCLMQYLCRYLGSPDAKACGLCTRCGKHGERYEKYREPMPEAEAFLASLLPRLGGCRDHEGGYALDFHTGTDVGETLSRAKYGSKGTVPEWIVAKAADCVKAKYARSGFAVAALTFIPPNSERVLVEDFANRLAALLKVPCVALLTRARPSDLQKDMKTRAEKRANISGAFAIAPGVELPGGSVLLVDDIYDSGWTFREAARVIRGAFPNCRIRVLALTRTHHSDDY